MKSRIFSILFCTAVSTGIVMYLFQNARHLNHDANTFTRLYPPHFLARPSLLELKYNSFYLAGFTKYSIYLANRTAAGILLRTNYRLSDSTFIALKVPDSALLFGKAIHVSVDSPVIFMMEGISPQLLTGDFVRNEMRKIKYSGPSFNVASFLPDSSVIIRYFDTDLSQNALSKYSIGSNTFRASPKLLVKKGDGVFSLDGNISIDKFSKNVLYTYYYRNEYLVMDSNLNILYKGKTIDTTEIPKIKLATISSTHTTTFSAPPLTVNYTSCVDSGFLYINSRLRARNDDEQTFNDNSIIDIYSLKSPQYLYSFTIPNFNGQRLIYFQITGRHLIVLYEHTLFTFQING